MITPHLTLATIAAAVHHQLQTDYPGRQFEYEPCDDDLYPYICIGRIGVTPTHGKPHFTDGTIYFYEERAELITTDSGRVHIQTLDYRDPNMYHTITTTI